MKKLYLLGAILASTFTMTAHAASEQVWEATHSNTQQVCGIDYTNSQGKGQILTKGESNTDTAKAIEFSLKANTRHVNWKVTEAKITDNAGMFDFQDDLLKVGEKAKTSLFVNNTEFDWTQVNTNHVVVDKKQKLRLAPKINLDATEFPLGTTKIQGKIVVTCSN